MTDQPYGGQPYGGQPYPGQPYPGAPAKTAGKAVASLVTGIVALLLCGLLAGIPAIILGIVSNKEIKRSNGQLTGGGLAIAGIVLGVLGTLWSLAIIALVVVGISTGNGTICGSTTSNGSTTSSCNN